MSLNAPFDSKSSVQSSNIGHNENDRLCTQCSRIDIETFFSTSRSISENDDPGERWGIFAERDFQDIKKSVHCPLCQLICKALPKAKHSRRPKDKDRIYFYCMLFGEYEMENIPLDHEVLAHWRLHRTNRPMVSTIKAVLITLIEHMPGSLTMLTVSWT
jgi:rubredoxin